MVTPNETIHTRVEDTPNYLVDPVLTWTLALVVLELLILDKNKYAFNDHVTSTNTGMMYLLMTIGGHDISAWIYPKVYDRVHIIDLPNDSALTWILCLFTQDLMVYIAHRAMHEVSFLWWAHKMHHSSEYLNLTTALRLPVLQSIVQMFPELLQAFFIPPNIYVIHRALNLSYQFWIHTTTVPYLGPLEYFLNTPSSHRVHHGRNPYCIDKNYGCTLIIWDRIFGSYAPERKGEEIEYGLVKPVNTFDQLYNQFCELKALTYDKGQLRNEKNEEVFPGVWNKIKAALLPPAYLPGMRTKWFFLWLCLEDNTDGVPEIKRPVIRYNPSLSRALQYYLFGQWILLLYHFVHFVGVRSHLGWPEFFCRFSFIIAFLQMFGYYFDHNRFALQFDIARLLTSTMFGVFLSDWLMTVYGFVSLGIALWLCIAGKICASCRHNKLKCSFKHT